MVNHHGTSPGLFTGTHLCFAQKPASKCYDIEEFIGMIVLCSSLCTMLCLLEFEGCVP